MKGTIVVGDGPAGLSAALFLAKNGHPVTVVGSDESWVHKAMLYNYLGIPEMQGPEFIRVARKQVEDRGARLVHGKVTQAERTGDGFRVTLEGGEQMEAKHLILACGPDHTLGESLGLAKAGKGLEADRNGRTAVPGLYVVGWMTRPDKIQAVISAGDGAAAALDVLSGEAGKDIHDFDLLPQ